MTLELLYLPSCPHHRAALDLVQSVLKEEGLGAHFIETPISDYEEAERHRFPGSPTFRVNGRDIEGVSAGFLPVGLACRTYLVDGKSEGVPPRIWLERAVRAAQNSEGNRS
jgi:hypothetical protein